MRRPNHIAALDQWAESGKAFTSSTWLRPDWSAVESLIETAQRRLLEDSRILRELLKRSKNQFQFDDPLLCDLGLHRWLAKDREEAYCDWLAWVLEQFHKADVVLRVLGVRDQAFQSLCSEGPYRVEREAFVKEGAPSCEGRIDLLVHFGEPERALLGVEVKTWDECYEKQRGYLKSVRERCEHAKCVLVAIPEVSQDIFGFGLRRWQEVGVALRREVARYVTSQGGTVVAMMLGFVGAIEQNLLGFGSAAARRAWNNQPTLLSKGLERYMTEALET